MLRTLLCITTMWVWTLVLFPVALLAMVLAGNAGASIWVARRLWSPLLIRAGGARLQVSGHENLVLGKPAIYVSNHQSTLDIPILLAALPVNLRFVAKKQLGHLPLIGWYLRLAKHILIDRKDPRAARASLDQAARRIREGISIIIFPEGTRSPDGHILPFKKGPFALAMKAHVPLVPVAIEGSGALMPKNSWHITPGKVRVHIGRPIDPTPYLNSPREDLLRAVRAAIIEQHRAIGGQGGDLKEAVAARGREGVSESGVPAAPDQG